MVLCVIFFCGGFVLLFKRIFQSGRVYLYQEAHHVWLSLFEMLGLLIIA